MTGRPPKPSNLRLIQGNPGRRPLNQSEPDPEPSIPSCPRHLNKIARSEWRRVSKELFGLGLVTQIDRAVLSAYCDSYALWVEASLQVQKLGMLVKAPSGYPIQSPYLAIRNAALEQMRTCASEFGMTPSSRSRVKTANPKQRNLFGDFLDGEDAEDQTG